MESMFRKELAGTAIGSSLATLLATVLFACAVVDTPQAEVGASDQIGAERMRARAEPHRERVLTSMSANDGELWGSYGHSNGFEHLDLDLGPDGFYLEYSHCTGIGEIAYGRIARVEGSLVRLEIAEHAVVGGPRPVDDRRRHFRFAEELYAIPWSGERFLVTPELMPEFCRLAKGEGYDSMKFADYPRRLAPGERAWSHSLALEGLPDVPCEFRDYLPD